MLCQVSVFRLLLPPRFDISLDPFSNNARSSLLQKSWRVDTSAFINAMLQLQLRRLLRGRFARAASETARPTFVCVGHPAQGPGTQVATPIRGVAAAAGAATSAPPSPGDLPDIHAVPGSSAFGDFVYAAGTEAPYPIWLLSPDGVLYKSVLSVARNSSVILDAVHDTAGLPWLVSGVTLDLSEKQRCSLCAGGRPSLHAALRPASPCFLSRCTRFATWRVRLTRRRMLRF